MEIIVENVTKNIGKNEIIKTANLKFESGNIIGFIGRNGSGKSVFQKLLCGFYTPTTGRILVDGKDINSPKYYPKEIRVLIEKPSFYPDLTGQENLELLAGITNKISKKEIIAALEIVNLISEKDKKYSKYSLGMKQKLGVAQAIMEDTSIIILDEPFNGIENESVKKISEYLKKIKKDKIIIISTHIKEDIENLCDVVYEFDNGYINEKNCI